MRGKSKNFRIDSGARPTSMENVLARSDSETFSQKNGLPVEMDHIVELVVHQSIHHIKII